jgi:predicted RNA-binding Zn-ribbon protein involved in translation (DUF1610 family)
MNNNAGRQEGQHMSPAMTPTERALRERAIDYACPECGAKAGIRCRIVTHRPARPGYPKGTRVDVRPNSCAERASLAWPAMLAEMTSVRTGDEVAASWAPVSTSLAKGPETAR